MKHSILKSVFTSIAIAISNYAAHCQTIAWDHRCGGTITSATIDESGNTYTTGYFLYSSSDFAPGPDVVNLPVHGGYDIFIQKLDSSGNFVWVKGMGSADTDAGLAITVDKHGNVYSVGYFSDRIDLDPGPGILFRDASWEGLKDMYIQKLDSAGNLVWAKQIANANDILGNAIAVDDNFVYITGSFKGRVDFDPGFDEFELHAPSSGAKTNAFILKLDTAGDFVWAGQMGGGGADEGGFTLVVDDSGNIYSAGEIGSMGDYDPGVDTLELNPGQGDDTYIQKLDAAGNLVWIKQLSSIGYVKAKSITIDTFGSLYLTGIFRRVTDFDPGASTFNLQTFNNIYQEDAFILKLNAQGNFIWAKRIGSDSLTDSGTSVVVDHLGNVYTGGYFKDTIDMDPGVDTFNLYPADESDGFIQKLDSSGNFVWAMQIDGEIGAIKLDEANNLYVFTDLRILKIGLPLPVINSIKPDLPGFKIFPNPSSGDITLNMDKLYPKLCVQTVSVQGQILSTQNFEQSQVLNLQIEGARGIYILNILDSDGRVASLPVIKQ